MYTLQGDYWMVLEAVKLDGNYGHLDGNDPMLVEVHIRDYNIHGDDLGPISVVVYSDGKVFVPADWQSWQPSNLSEVDQIDWVDAETGIPAVMWSDGLPKASPFTAG